MARPAAPKSSTPATVTAKASEPLLTQEAFEKELKGLALKATEETVLKWVIEQFWLLMQAGTCFILAAISSNVSKLTLSPVYGGIPSSLRHSTGIWISCFLGWSLNLFFRRRLPVKPRHLLPVIMAYIPVVQFFLFKASSLLGAVYGPIITEALTFLPLVIISVSVAASLLDELDMKLTWVPTWISDSLPGMFSFTFFKTIELWTAGEIQSSIGRSFFQTRLGLQIALTIFYSIFAPSKLLLFTIPAVLHTAIFNTHVPSSFALSSLNSTLVKNGWSLLERQESLTGYISILENQNQGFRAMRCDHSLLGGEWLGGAKTNGVAEPIYGVFVMLEAVRLVETTKPAPDSEAKAFVIGLGIGTTPAAFIKHGIQTTIVEIDPIVHKFANKYFGLPANHTPVIADAASYTAEVALSEEKYDYVVHDVFTGGAEPIDLFTYEFLSGLNRILKPEGVIAINYAGDIKLPSARIIIHTILSIFPTCRIFRESAAPTAAKVAANGGRDFTNMVIFCTNAPRQSGGLTFRNPTEQDLLGSNARKMFLLPIWEVDVAEWDIETEDGVEGKKDGGDSGNDFLVLRSNSTAVLAPWQAKSALGHWAVMRTVIPSWIWDSW